MGVSEDSMAVVVGVIGGQVATQYMQGHIPGMSRIPSMWIKILVGALSFYIGESKGQGFLSNVGLGMFAGGMNTYISQLNLLG